MLEKNYDPGLETELFDKWMERGYFRSEPNPDKKPFTIVMPPPNVTGIAHMGHALNTTVQDILTRARRMQGYEALWLPGTDHAAIATEVRIINEMAAEGMTKDDLGREAFLERAWAWNDKYGGTIIKQLKRLGFSCDWDRERFTMDEGLSNAVLEVFIRLYKEGKVYRGERLVNWCTHCQTTISDAEVLHKESDSAFYHFKYPIMGMEGGFLAFATTRPETMLGDTAIAVNPDDDRYRKYVGKTVKVPFVDREIPIIADEYVEAEFGTGIVKITPGHDPNDFEVGERHGLSIINILNDDGTLNENTGGYAGMDRKSARERIIREMDELGLFIKKEQLQNNVGTHDRCGDVIEPLIKLQWFVRMKELAEPAIDVYKSGELRFNRERYGKIYLHWLENIKDWCISRQVWWGHRIPAYYCTCGHMTVAKDAPVSCEKCGGTDLCQDEDTLDTWFSSALWPFSTLGWPERTEELEYYYPTDVLVTADEIIFFWVVRMVFSGLHFMGERPFSDVIIHGKVLDGEGRKMSKSLGNGINPMDVIEKYGADALRLTLISGNSIETDIRFSWDRLDPNRNFLNKVWNASRFMLMQFEPVSDTNQLDQSNECLAPEDKWILSRMNDLVKEVTEKLDIYELGMAAQAIVDFFWNEFCDWYVEMVKPRLYNKEDSSRSAALWTLKQVLTVSLKLLHPYTPFITETIFLKLQEEEETIMLSAWPEYDEKLRFPSEVKEVERIQEAVRAVRNIRAEKQVPPSKKVKIISVCNWGTVPAYFAFLAGAEEVELRRDAEGIPSTAVSVVTSGAVLYLPLDTLIDFEQERARLDKERKKLEQELARVEGKLSNEGFVKKAPPQLIAAEEEKREKFRDMLKKVEEQAESLLG